MKEEERKLYDAANKYAWDIESGDLNTNRDSFIAGANWQYEQFENERLKNCDELTAEQAQMESDFVVQHLEKYNSTPTYSDAIEYGKKQVIDKACQWLNNFYSEDRHCFLVKEDIDAFIKAMEE
jgi:hypothetical protein